MMQYKSQHEMHLGLYNNTNMMQYKSSHNLIYMYYYTDVAVYIC